jgi:hypothetical protein
MSKSNLKLEYRNLEMKVFRELREAIERSEINSKFISYCKAIPINLYDYVELAIVNDKLTFLDRNGYHYSTYSEASLEDLIDILSKL